MPSHARLSPSAASRWMSCAGSIRLTEQMPTQDRDTSNRFSQEGTLAHECAEITASIRLGIFDTDIGHEMLDTWRSKVERAEFDADEMQMHAHGWAALLHDFHKDGLTIHLERRVATGVPQSWGTTDAVAYDDGFVVILDYKYGKGVEVDAEDNPQMMLYGLGAMETFAPKAETVQMTIWQPRRDHDSTATMTAKELREWRDAVALPAAKLALSHDAPVTPSQTACQFCPAAGSCLARQESLLSQDFGTPELMTGVELAETMGRLDELTDWISAVRKTALEHARNGEPLPGWKLVRKAGRRKILDETGVIERLGQSAVRTSLKPLGELEKLVGGRKALTEEIGDLITKAEGSEVLVPEDDPRESVHPGDDFRDSV